jgi:hypothetical protein
MKRRKFEPGLEDLPPGVFFFRSNLPSDLEPNPVKVLLPGNFLHRDFHHVGEFFHRPQGIPAGGTVKKVRFYEGLFLISDFLVKVFF